jgi:hypothetical protein
MMNKDECCDFLTYLNDYVDGTLRGEICQVLEEHIGHCNKCEIVVNTLKKTVELYQLNDEAVHLPEDAKRKLFVSLNLEEYLEK